MGTELDAAVRELYWRLHDLDLRVGRAASLVGANDQASKFLQSAYPGAEAPPAVGVCGTLGSVGVVYPDFCVDETIPFYLASFQPGGGVAPSYIPFGELTWNGSDLDDPAGSWTGCVMFDRRATTGCTARTIPLFFELFPNIASPSSNWTFRCSWINTSGTCVDSGKTCADVASVTHHVDGTATPQVYIGAVSGDSTTVFTGSLGFPNLSDAVPGLSGADVAMVINQPAYNERTWLKETIHLVDSMYGAVDLAWSIPAQEWQGCIAGISYPGYAPSGCVARTMAVNYGLDINGTLNVRYSGTSGCPNASTCATGTNTTISFVLDGTEVQTYTPSFSVVYNYSGGTTPSAAAQRLYRNTAATLTITNP